MIKVEVKFSNEDLSYTYEGVRDPELDKLLKEIEESIGERKD
jgi:hypothetical protein